MSNFNLKKYLAEGKLHKPTLNEFIGGELEKRNEPLYDKLVPGSGAAGTIEGEMLRAINKIIYRYYNDGDKYFLGYGIETAGPAHSYLVNSNSPIKSQLNKIFSGIDLRFEDEVYEGGIERALELIVGYVEEKVKDNSLSPNTEDMYDYESEFEDEEEDDDYGYDDDYEDEDEDEY
tara:strand:- start:383 stop:910 length:528 start_codon:yes stop_codon:yes gene_type:complete